MDNKQKSREYWEKRARENENKVYKKAGDLKKNLDEHYIKARREIQKSINDLVARYMDKTELSYVDAMKNLTSSEFKEWKMTLEEYEKEISRLFKAGEEELANKLRIELETLAIKSRITRLDSLKTQIDIELNRKASRDYDVVKKGITDVYKDFYTITTSDFGLTGVNTVLPDKVLRRLINQPWSGANFSERIWGNAEILGKVLKQEIIQSFIQGISVKDLSDRIQNRFEADRKNTERLVRTELNHALNETTKLSYEEAEIEEYEYLAEIDGRTSDICRELNGQKFKMKDAKVGVNYPPMHPNCFDQETEIYTNKGWKFFKDLDKSELVYTVNPDTLNVEWQKPINYISYKYKGKMLYYENSRFNLMITPQHKILVQNMDNTVKNKSWKLKEAVKVGRKSKNRMLSGINWQGKTKDFEFLAEKKVDIELYLKFMAYWLADGSCTKDRGSYNIKIAQCENDWMYEELKEIPFKIYKCKESLIIHNKELGNELSGFGKCTEKYIPENIKELNPELIRIFLMAYAKTDGHIRKGKNWKGYQFNDSIVFFTTSDKMASDLGELILKAGGRPSYYLNKIEGKEIEFKNGKYTINKDCWVISWNTQIYTWISNLNISEIDYNDNVYCVEVLKYNTVLVRRNGKVCWSGNCRSTTVPVIDYENFGKKKDNDKSKQENKKITANSKKENDIIKENDVFIKAKTIKEANQFAIEKLGINANYKGIDLKCANEWNEGLFRMKEKFPEIVKEGISFVGATQERNILLKRELIEYVKNSHIEDGHSEKMAELLAKKEVESFMMKFRVKQNNMAVSFYVKSDNNPTVEVLRKANGITMNNKFFNDYENAIANKVEQVKRKWKPIGCDTVKGTFDHEFGHQIDSFLKIRENQKIIDLYEKLTKEELKENLSGYSAENIKEFIAESWSEYVNNPNPREISKTIGSLIEEEWEKWKTEKK